MRRLLLTLAVTSSLIAVTVAGSAQPRRPLRAADVDAIATLLMLEDTRKFDEAVLARLVKHEHPEVRQRAIISIGRIVNPAGRAILSGLRTESDADTLANVAFATGQIKDADAVSWLNGLLRSERTRPAVAREAARALGKIRTPEARAALASYLSSAPSTLAASPIVGEALLSIGRFTTPDDLAPVLRWKAAADPDVRWRAAWALFRPRNSAAVPHLFEMTRDASPEVRFWAMRGLTPALVDEAGIDRAKSSARLRDALDDSDRRVRTEALRTLVLYDEEASVRAVVKALESGDTWLSVSAAEGLGSLEGHATSSVPALIAASASTRPLALRVVALSTLASLAPEAALEPAASLAAHPSSVARMNAVQVLQKLGEPGRARLETLIGDPAVRQLLTPPAGGRGDRPAPPVRSQADYRRIAEKSIVPDISGSPKPRAVLSTAKGEIEIELYPGDAPLGVEYFVTVVDSGSIVGTEFGRVVPNFVAQQRPIRGALTLRDEVSRRGLTRGNLSWASAGLDTGRPGYTFGSTPQPHNEGDFTALGRIVRGMDVVDRLELGDSITAARVLR